MAMTTSTTMRGETATTDVERLLAAARATLAEMTHCWVMTPSASDGIHARVVEPIAAAPDDEDWIISFATSARSRKAAEIERAGRLTLGYERHSDHSYVALYGRAVLVVERSAIRARWREPWRLYFPGGPEDPNLIIVRLAVDRIELCVPGVTPEPFGTRYVAVVRDAAGVWTIASD
jgi:general stress protein 26